jgi:uncharacterized membrane protein YtjA (UPF0391 family)
LAPTLGWSPLSGEAMVSSVEGANTHWNHGAWSRLFAFHGEYIMLRWAFMFLVLALIAGIFGFGGVAAASAGIAKTLFMVFVIFAVIALVVGLITGKKLTT